MPKRFMGSDEDLGFNHEINVTPFIDVALVLLIIFMAAAPLSMRSVSVELPAAAASALPLADKPIYISLQENHALYLGEEAVSLEDLLQKLSDLLQDKDKKAARIFIRADKNVNYGSVTDILNRLRAGGYSKIGLVGAAAA